VPGTLAVVPAGECTAASVWTTGLPDPSILTGQLAATSLAGYRRDVALYLRFCADPATALHATSLARWRTHLAEDTRLSPATINRRLAAVKRLLQEAAAQGYADVATAEAFRRVAGVQTKALKDRLKVTARTRITTGQMRQLCEAPDRAAVLGWRNRAFLHTLASSGCRLSEVVTLTTAQLLSRDGSFFLEVLGKNQTEPRLAPLSHEAYASIQAWLARRLLESPYVFTSFAGKGHRPTTRPMHLSAAWRVVQRAAAHVGLAHVKPHDFRRFVGTELARRDIRLAQKALGHKRIETTARHYVLDELAGGLTDHLY
jgi:site-specific recombinase XerD